MSSTSQTPTNNIMPAAVSESSRGRHSVGPVDGDSYYSPVVRGRSASVLARPIADGDFCPAVVPGRSIAALADPIDGDSYHPPVDSGRKASAPAVVIADTPIPVITPDCGISALRTIAATPTTCSDDDTPTSAFDTASSTGAEDSPRSSASPPSFPSLHVEHGPSFPSLHVEHGGHGSRAGCRAAVDTAAAEVEDTKSATWPTSDDHVVGGNALSYTHSSSAFSCDSTTVRKDESAHAFRMGGHVEEPGETPHGIHWYTTRREEQMGRDPHPPQRGDNPGLFSNAEGHLWGRPGPSQHRPSSGNHSHQDEDDDMSMPQDIRISILPGFAPSAAGDFIEIHPPPGFLNQHSKVFHVIRPPPSLAGQLERTLRVILPPPGFTNQGYRYI